MKKFIISSGLFVAALLGANTASAQIDYINVAPQTKQCTPAANCGQVCNSPCDTTVCNFGARPGKACYNAFEGLNLTEQQKTQLAELRKEHKARGESRQQAKADYRKDRLAKIKSILTPEQYLQFLENSYLQSGGDRGPRFSKDVKRHDKMKDGKIGRGHAKKAQVVVK